MCGAFLLGGAPMIERTVFASGIATASLLFGKEDDRG